MPVDVRIDRYISMPYFHHCNENICLKSRSLCSLAILLTRIRIPSTEILDSHLHKLSMLQFNL